MGAGLDSGRGVTARVVCDWASHMVSELGQVARQLVDPVDGAEVDLAGFVVNHQMCETSLRWEEGEEGGGRRGGGGHGHGGGEEMEEDGEDKHRMIGVGGHGGEGRGGVRVWVLVCICGCVKLHRVSQ